MDLLIESLDNISCNTPVDETLILINSVEYTYNPNTIYRYLQDAKLRFKRYIHHINFNASGHEAISKRISFFLDCKQNRSNAISQQHEIQVIDKMILNALGIDYN